MNRFARFMALVLVSLVAVQKALEFLSGYQDSSRLGGVLTSLVLVALACCAVIITGIDALFRREWKCALTSFTALCVSLLVTLALGGAQTFLFGLSTRLHQSSSAEEIIAAAQTCLSLEPGRQVIYGPPSWALHPDAADVEENHRLWKAFDGYAFLHREGGAKLIFLDGPDVSFELGGGALIGHWGITVFGSPERTPPSTDRTRAIWLRFSDRII